MKYLNVIFLALLTGFSGLGLQAQVQTGDTLSFWSVSYIDWPPLWGAPQRNFPAVCKGAGDHCYVFVETGVNGISQTVVDELVSNFDTDFFPRLSAKYGPVPDQFDHDSAVFIVVLDESDWGGYFDPGQQMADSVVNARWSRHSSERELIYVAASSFNYSAEPIVAHEFGHLLHWQQDHSAETDAPGIFWEEAFVDEGFSTFAAEFLTENLDQHNVFEGSAFFKYSPDIPLLYFSNYNQAQLFMTFMYQHFGRWSYISALIQNQLNGWQGVDSTLRLLGHSATFNDAFADFCVANYIDDSVFEGGRYSYEHFRFPAALVENQHSVYPLSSGSGDLSPYGNDYILFTSSSPQAVQINFQGDASSNYRLAFIARNALTKTTRAVAHVLPDASGLALYQADSLGVQNEEVVMVVMCTDPELDTNERVNYTYSAASVASSDAQSALPALRIYPNPAKDKLYIEWSPITGKRVKAEVMDTAGRNYGVFRIDEASHSIDVRKLPAGAYTLRLSDDKTVRTVDFIRQP